MSDGTRTHDRLDHNQELYQLSYAHRGGLNLAADGAWIEAQRGVRQLSPSGAGRALAGTVLTAASPPRQDAGLIPWLRNEE